MFNLFTFFYFFDELIDTRKTFCWKQKYLDGNFLNKRATISWMRLHVENVCLLKDLISYDDVNKWGLSLGRERVFEWKENWASRKGLKWVNFKFVWLIMSMNCDKLMQFSTVFWRVYYTSDEFIRLVLRIIININKWFDGILCW